jgi:hypothetical protein
VPFDREAPERGCELCEEAGAAGGLGDGLADASLGNIVDALSMRNPDGAQNLPLAQRWDVPSKGNGGAFKKSHGALLRLAQKLTNGYDLRDGGFLTRAYKRTEAGTGAQQVWRERGASPIKIPRRSAE